MISGMGTKTLTLKWRAKAGARFYYTRWTDDRGGKHAEYFGSEKRQAQIDFSAFHAKWQRDARIRNPKHTATAPLREVYPLFQTHAKAHYVRADGSSTGKAAGIDNAMKPMLDLFGDEPMDRIDLSSLASARDEMIRLKWSVNTINERVRLIRQVWRWFVTKSHARAEVWHGMQALQPLAPGRGVEVDGVSVTVPANEPVTPVSDADLLAVLDRASQTVQDMIWVQMLTAMRPTELCIMRPVDIDTTGPIWLYRPRHHKTQHRSKVRIVAIGPRAQQHLKPYIGRRLNVEHPVFSIAESSAEQFEMKRAAYKPGKRGDYRRWKSYEARDVGGRGGVAFDRNTYAKAIRRACVAAGIDVWSPNQLRHNAATNVRKQFGIEAAQAVLGHAKASTTEIYAQIGMERAVAAMERIG